MTTASWDTIPCSLVDVPIFPIPKMEAAGSSGTLVFYQTTQHCILHLDLNNVEDQLDATITIY